MSRRSTYTDHFQPSVYSTGLQPVQSYPVGEMGVEYGMIWPWEIPGLIRKYWWVPPAVGLTLLAGITITGVWAARKVHKATRVKNIDWTTE